jgi:hypothetical protein
MSERGLPSAKLTGCPQEVIFPRQISVTSRADWFGYYSGGRKNIAEIINDQRDHPAKNNCKDKSSHAGIIIYEDEFSLVWNDP